VRRYGAIPLRLTPYVPDGTYGDAPRVPIEQVYPVIVNDLQAATQELPPDFATHTYSSADRGRPTASRPGASLARSTSRWPEPSWPELRSPPRGSSTTIRRAWRRSS